MFKKLNRNSLIFAAFAFLAAPVSVAAQDSGLASWSWTAEGYFWGADLGGETTTDGNIDMPIDDIIEDLIFGVMGRVFAEKGPWLLFADAFYLDVGETDDATAGIGPIGVDVKGSFDLKGFSSTFGGGYKVVETAGTTMHAVGGVRFLWLDGEVEVDGRLSVGGTPVSGRVVNEREVGNNWDAIVGLYGKTNINDKWYLSYYGDIGTGNSNFTWQAELAANYRMQSADLVVGYRYLDFDLDDFGPIDDLNMGGPFVGVKFRF